LGLFRAVYAKQLEAISFKKPYYLANGLGKTKMNATIRSVLLFIVIFYVLLG